MDQHEQWLKDFRAATAPLMGDPFLACLAEAIASVESGWGDSAIREQGMVNEIGYKAVPGKPSTSKGTKEAEGGKITKTRASFRLFADRKEQAESLRYLLRSSLYFDAARLMFLLTFYASYAPGRVDGILDVVKNFNQIAATGTHPGVKPLRFADPRLAREADLSEGDVAINHKAIRDAVLAYGEMCHRSGQSVE